MSTFVYTDTVAAQCAIWNTAINPASGQPYNTIETASGSVIGVANLQTGVAETQEGTPLSQGGLQCVVKGDQVFHPDDLDNPLDVDSEDQDQDGIPDICAIIGDLPICTPEPPPGGDGTTDGGGDTGGGGNVGGGGGTGNNGSGSGGGKPQEFTTNPATLGSNQANQSADLALVAGSSGDRMLCEGGKRNCEHTNLGAGLGQELRLGLDRAPQIIDRRKLEDNPFDLIDQESAKEGESIRPNLGKVFGYANHSTIPAATSLSVDDEVLKTAMAVYTPLRRLRADFLNDPNSRDAYLDSALTLRGVTVMAMGFLDKTLGAGLHATDLQATGAIQNELLKQLNWTTTRLANQERDEVMRDVDMKVEACLEQALTQGSNGAAAATVQPNSTTRGWVWTEQCSPECGVSPDTTASEPFRGTDPKIHTMGNGTYAYCVCCAETAKNLNQLHADGSEARSNTANPREQWSLVERAFYGIKPQGKAAASLKQLDPRVEAFKMLFGDVILKRVNDGGESSSSGQEGFYHYAAQMPKASPRKITSLFKNICYHDPSGKPVDLSKKGTQSGCQLNAMTNFKINCGICPAAIDIMAHWDEVLDGSYSGGTCGGVEQTWMEATMGMPLTGREIKQFLLLNGDPNANLKNPKEIAARVIESWCEASAVAATARLYASMRTVAADHMTLSNALTDRERMKFIELTSRWGETLAMAQLDSNSKLASLAVLTGASIFYDRERAAMTASSQVAMSSRATESGQFAGMLVLGGSGLAVGDSQ